MVREVDGSVIERTTTEGQMPPIGARPPSFADLYEEHFEFVWRAARRLGVPEANAEDAVQDSFVVLHRKIAEYNGQTPLRRWLLGIVTRVASDYRRRYRRKEAKGTPLSAQDDGDVRFASTLPAPNETAERNETARLVEALLATLEDEKREVLVLIELEDLTAAEVAEMTGVNINTIYTRLRAARRAFELAFEEHQQAQVATSARKRSSL